MLSNLGIINLPLPDLIRTDAEKQDWLFNELLPQLKNEYSYLKRQISEYDKFKFDKETKKIVKRFMSLERVMLIIHEIKKELEDRQKIIIQAGPEFIEFKVLYGYNLFEKYFANKAQYFLHMSATILSKEQYCKKLNLSYDEVEYLEYESEFPVENRLIYYTPVGSLAFKHKKKTLPLLIEKIKEILKLYPTDKRNNSYSKL